MTELILFPLRFSFFPCLSESIYTSRNSASVESTQKNRSRSKLCIGKRLRPQHTDQETTGDDENHGRISRHARLCKELVTALVAQTGCGLTLHMDGMRQRHFKEISVLNFRSFSVEQKGI